MAETEDAFPRVLETSQYEIGGVYKRAIQIKKDRLCLILQVALPVFMTALLISHYMAVTYGVQIIVEG